MQKIQNVYSLEADAEGVAETEQKTAQRSKRESIKVENFAAIVKGKSRKCVG